MKYFALEKIFRCTSRAVAFLLSVLFLVVITGCNQEGVPEPLDSAPDSLTVEMTATDSITVLELLLENHEVDYRSSLIGAFVTSIDSVANSSAAYWVYSVNDTSPKVACDKLTLKPGDRLQWHYRRVTPSVLDSTAGK